MPRTTGTVKMFIDHKLKADGSDGGGYGFILPDDGGEDVFVHRTDLGPSCLQPVAGGDKRILFEQQKVSFEIVTSTRGNGKKAVAVELI